MSVEHGEDVKVPAFFVMVFSLTVIGMVAVLFSVSML